MAKSAVTYLCFTFQTYAAHISYVKPDICRCNFMNENIIVGLSITELLY